MSSSLDRGVYVIAIDAGTSSVRSIAFDKKGHGAFSASRVLQSSYPNLGWVEQDPKSMFDAVRSTLLDVSRLIEDEGGSVVAVGITNQRETALSWDAKTGSPLYPAIVWQDRRTAQRCEELRIQGAEPMIRKKTGLVADSYFSATKWEWMLDHGVRKSPTLRLGTVDSWIVWNLTKDDDTEPVFATDSTNASRTLLAEITTGVKWDEELVELFSIPSGSLGEIKPSCGHFGSVASGVFGKDSILAGAPICGIAGDQQAALFGQRCFRPQTGKVTYGTGSFLLQNVGPKCPQPPEGLLATLAFDAGPFGTAYGIEGAAFVSGASIQWLRDELCLINSAEEFGPLAASVPDAGGVTFVPAFTGLGSPWWDPHARGTITGITRGTTSAHIARALADAIAYQVDDMLVAMSDAGYPCSELRVDGGASAMDLLCQHQADLSDVTLRRPRFIEATALGASFLAGLAVGFFESLDALEALPFQTSTFEPHHDPLVANLERSSWHRGLERARGWAME